MRNGYYRDDQGDQMAGWAVWFFIGLFVLLGIAMVTFVVKISPYIWRGMAGLTHILSPPLAALTNKLTGWPSEGSITSPGTASLLGAALWAGMALLGSTLCLILGASPVIVPISLAIGVVTGATLGASAAAQPNQTGSDLKDYLRF